MLAQRRQFTGFSRLRHWTMASMVLTMLCIGVAMVTSLADYHVLVSIHRPLGVAILILVVVRFVNRLLNPPRRCRPRCRAWNVWRRLRPNSRCTV
jgi:cytochrome b561